MTRVTRGLDCRLIGQRLAHGGAEAVAFGAAPLGAAPDSSALQRAANQPKTNRKSAKPTQVNHAGVFGSSGGTLSTNGLEGKGDDWGSE